MPTPLEHAPPAACGYAPPHAFGLPPDELEPGPGVIACELPHLACLWLRGHGEDAAFRHQMRAVLGVALPLQAHSLSGFGGGTGGHGLVLAVSPDEWLLLGRRSQREQLLRAMHIALLDVFAQVVDTSAAMTSLRLAGPQCLALLRHLGLCDAARPAPGQGSGAVLAAAGVTVLRTDVQGVLLVLRRVVAGQLWRLIERSAQPLGLRIGSPASCTDPFLNPLLEAA